MSSSPRTRGLLARFIGVFLATVACAEPAVAFSAAMNTPTVADTLRIAIPAGGVFNTPFGPLTNAASALHDDQKAVLINGFIHEALYRYDESYRPVPSLA